MNKMQFVVSKVRKLSREGSFETRQILKETIGVCTHRYTMMVIKRLVHSGSIKRLKYGVYEALPKLYSLYPVSVVLNRSVGIRSVKARRLASHIGFWTQGRDTITTSYIVWYARNAGYSRSTAMTAINHLMKEGVIKRVERGLYAGTGDE